MTAPGKITHKQARESALRLIRGAFRSDDDTIVIAYIEQQAALFSPASTDRERAIEEKLHLLIERTSNPTPTNMSDRRILDWVNGQARLMLALLTTPQHSEEGWIKIDGDHDAIPDDLDESSEVRWQEVWYLDAENIWRPRGRTPVAYRRASGER
jgi:hypothetical protein